MGECKPLPSLYRSLQFVYRSYRELAEEQGRTLVHVSAQRKRFLWDRGCIQGLCSGCLGGVRGYLGCILDQRRLSLSRQSGRV